MHVNQQDQSSFDNMPINYEFWFLTIVKTFANYVYVLNRQHFGRDYFGLSALTSLLAPIVLFVFLSKDIPPTYLPIMSVVFFIALLRHRIATFRRPAWMRVHTKYNGFPNFCKSGKYSEGTAKQWIEPAFTLVLGLAIGVFDIGIGIFLVIAAFAAALDSSVSERRWYQRIRRIEDAEIESELTFDDLDQRSYR